jgi:C4-dicarboxylate-specific signal transduction histidine kinase
MRWRQWPLVAATAGMLAVGGGVRAWLHANLENVDANDAVMLGVADTALAATIGAGLLMVALASLLLDRQRRQIELELEHARTELAARGERAAEHRRLGMLGSLAGGLAHELGQPLSAARVGIEGLHYLRQLGREPSPEHVARTLSQVGMSILAMTQTIEHLRNLAGSSASDSLTVVELGGCVAAVLAERDQWLRFSDVRIACDHPAGPLEALGDTAGLRLILTNLLRNAVEAVAGQGEERRLVRIALGPGPTVTVHDSGPGIAPDLLARIFDPFFSTKAASGRGIGLSLARASAQRMGAELTVSSSLGSGTAFTLHLLSPRGERSRSGSHAPPAS